MLRILIVRTDRIGDVILSIPVISALRRSFPEDHIAFLTRSYTKELLEGNPDLNEIIEYDPEQNLISTVRALIQKKFDIAILLHPTFRLALLLFLSRITIRIGTGYRFYSFLFNKRVHIHRKRDEYHEAEFNLQMLKPLLHRGDTRLTARQAESAEINFSFPKVYTKSTNREWMEEKLIEYRISNSEYRFTNKLIVVHPGNGGIGDLRSRNAPQWKVERFANIADRIQKELGANVLVTGSEEERGLCQEMGKLMNESKESPQLPVTNYQLQSSRNLAGETTIGQLTALLEKADLLVTNSTGPMHIASAVGTPVVAVFCPRRGCHPRRWGPLGEGNRVMMADVENCKMCSRKGKEADCMEMVDEEDVFKACKDILNHKITRD
jgi:heptosyltransferase-2